MKPENSLSKGYMSPKTKIGQQKMDVLISAASELFAENGFYDTSVADICKRANTAVGTFYIYFKTKTDVYACLLDKYQQMIKEFLDANIKGCATRYEKERAGIKAFIKFAIQNPSVYNVIWGSLSIDEKMFRDYYISFAKSYARSLQRDESDVVSSDYTTLAYSLMGISNFLGLRAIFEDMTDEQIDEMIDNTVMPALSNGAISPAK